MKRTVFITALIALAIAPRPSGAQASPDASPKAASSQDKRFYRLDFTIKQIEAGKVVNSRNYSLLLEEGHGRSSMRSGTKVPFKQGGGSQYVDVGLNIDCGEAVEVNGQLGLHIKAEMSNVVAPPESSPGELPAVRQNRWESDVLFPIRKATTIFSADDLASKQNVQLEVLATPLK